ncbi:unnamed protein product [Symbiodinium natans]|uniref:Uncharacterized protein n=1 Tax=Symbiodinium natans TaxID=878477 RepID=A0A812M7L2_9DINO|nr:unnamed protein product [Symbiodinium natans]
MEKNTEKTEKKEKRKERRKSCRMLMCTPATFSGKGSTCSLARIVGIRVVGELDCQEVQWILEQQRQNVRRSRTMQRPEPTRLCTLGSSAQVAPESEHEQMPEM